MVAGGFIAGAICTPDYARFLKNGTQVFWMTLIGTFLGELGMNLLAVLLANAMGTENIVDIMMATSGVLGVIIVVASTVKLNDINLYSSSLGLATMMNALFNKKISRNALVWALGIVGTFLSVIGIINYFTSFLTLLGVAIPPVAGIMVVDYLILKRNRPALEQSRAKGELRRRWRTGTPSPLPCGLWASPSARSRASWPSAFGVELPRLRGHPVLDRDEGVLFREEAGRGHLQGETDQVL